MLKTSERLMICVLGAAALIVSPLLACDVVKGKSVPLHLGAVEETESKASMGEPNHGYVGLLGSFIVTKNTNAMGLFVVHQYPDTSKKALGQTKLTYEGPKRLGNVDGWVFKTQWDGKQYPSKVFFSAQKVYFGGGINDYIAADYRDKSGWAWKLLPLRRMENVKANGEAAE